MGAVARVRLGQLFAHLGFLGEAHLGRGLGHIEDDELIAIIYRHRAELLARLQGTPDQSPQPTGADSVGDIEASRVGYDKLDLRV